MPPITALLHTENDAPRLGRTLETLLPCSEILIVDHHSSDATLHIAREYGARIMMADSALTAGLYPEFARNHWTFFIQPGESLSESLQSSLFEWRMLAHEDVAGRGYSVFLREQTGGESWRRSPEPEIRLVQRNWNRWKGNLPAYRPDSVPLEGELLRFHFP